MARTGKSIVVLAAPCPRALHRDGATVQQDADTIKYAKERARHYTSAAYAQGAEFAAPLGYACVKVNGEIVFEVGE